MHILSHSLGTLLADRFWEGLELTPYSHRLAANFLTTCAATLLAKGKSPRAAGADVTYDAAAAALLAYGLPGLTTSTLWNVRM